MAATDFGLRIRKLSAQERRLNVLIKWRNFRPRERSPLEKKFCAVTRLQRGVSGNNVRWNSFVDRNVTSHALGSCEYAGPIPPQDIKSTAGEVTLRSRR